MLGSRDRTPFLRHEDMELVRRVRAGDEAAFEELFDRSFNGLYRFALARVGQNSELAREVAQAAMCIAFEKLNTYRGEAPIFSWLCTICRFEITAHFRRRSRLAEVAPVEEPEFGGVELGGALDALASGADDPEAALLRQEVAGLVHQTVDRLPPQYGTALEWRYAEGLTVSEIAGRLEVSYKAAESILSRARQSFKDGFSSLTGWVGQSPRTAGEPR